MRSPCSGMVGSAGAAGAAGEVATADPGASLAAALLAAMARQHRQQEFRAMAVAPGPGLSEVLKPEVLAPLLADPEVRGARHCCRPAWTEAWLV